MLRLSSLSVLIVALLALSLTEEAPTLEASSDAVTEDCSFNENLALVEDYLSLLNISDPYLGDFDASVTVIEFFDPNCPHCATFHPIMKQVVEDSGQHARFFMIPFPLWQYSLLQIEALSVAAQDNMYFEMLDAQYLHQKQGGMSLEEVTVLASDIGLDPEVFRERVERGLNQRSTLERRSKIVETGVRGTPSVMINGRFLASDSKSRVCLNELIAAEANKG